MKDKVKQAMRSLLEEVADHEAETDFSAVSVDLGDLKRVLRWAQNNAYVWFEGDRVKRTGDGRLGLDWMSHGMLGTVDDDSRDDGTCIVIWDGGPRHHRRMKMYHNEIKRV